jgi:hypothetical protein
MATPIVTTAAFGHDAVFETDRTDGVVLVHNTVVEDAEADGDASLASLCCGD